MSSSPCDVLLDAKKLPPSETSGTWESDPFQLFFGSPPGNFPVLGLHTVALCGVYGPDDYKLCGPIGLVGLNVPIPNLNRHIPASLLAALTAEGFTPAPTPSSSDADATAAESEVEGSTPPAAPTEPASTAASEGDGTDSSSADAGAGAGVGVACGSDDAAAPTAVHSCPASNLSINVAFHTSPPPLPCQKFICSNTDEVNLMFHTWCYPDIDYNPEVVVKTDLRMGLFETQGIKPVHLDLKDSGISFDSFGSLTCVIHDCCFSPENAMFQLAHDRDICTFFSACFHPDRRDAIVTLHVLPCSDGGEAVLRATMAGSSCLREVLGSLRSSGFPEVADAVEATVVGGRSEK